MFSERKYQLSKIALVSPMELYVVTSVAYYNYLWISNWGIELVHAYLSYMAKIHVWIGSYEFGFLSIISPCLYYLESCQQDVNCHLVFWLSSVYSQECRPSLTDKLICWFRQWHLLAVRNTRFSPAVL